MTVKKFDDLQEQRGFRAYNEAFENFLSAARYSALNPEFGISRLVNVACELGYGAHYNEEGSLIAFAKIRDPLKDAEDNIFRILAEGTRAELELFAKTKIDEDGKTVSSQEGFDNMLMELDKVLSEKIEHGEPDHIHELELAA